MAFIDAINEVIRITKRPDKDADIRSQINRAISFFTLKTEFSKDLVESTLPIDATLYGDTVSIASLTRFRKFKYIKPTGKRYYLRTIDPVHLLTPQGQVQPNRFYVSANELTYTLSELNSSLEIGYYTYAPTLSADADTHWMLDMMYWAVIEKAASRIFFIIGDEQSAASYEKSAMDFYITGRNDFADQTSNESL